MPEYSFLNLEQIAEAQRDKEITANAILEALAKGTGALDVSVASGNVTLTETQSHYGVIRLTGAPGASRVVTVDADISRAILFINATTGGQVIEVEQTSGTNFPVPAGGAVLLLSTTQALTLPPRGVVTVPFLGASTGWLDMPAALTQLGGVAIRVPMDLSGFSQARIIAEVETAGAAGADLRGYYATTSGGSYAALDGGTGPEIAIGTTGFKESSWATIAAAARGEVYLQVYGIDGDGAVDPVFNSVALQFR